MLQESQKDNYKQDIHSKSEPYVFTHDHPFLLLCLCLLSPLNIKSHLALVCFAETTVFVTHSLPMRTIALQIITLMVYNRASFYYFFFLFFFYIKKALIFIFISHDIAIPEGKPEVITSD